MGAVADAILSKTPGNTAGILDPAVITAKAERQDNGDQLAGTPVKPKTYVDIYQMLNADKPLTAEEQQIENRRQKSSERMSAIGDAIGAIANMWGTAHGAQNAVDPQQTMSTRTQAYWDRLNKERRDNTQRYLSGLVNAAQLDMHRDNTTEAQRRAMEQLALQWANLRQQGENNKWERQYKTSESTRNQANTEKQLGIAQQNADTAAINARKGGSKPRTIIKDWFTE